MTEIYETHGVAGLPKISAGGVNGSNSTLTICDETKHVVVRSSEITFPVCLSPIAARYIAQKLYQSARRVEKRNRVTAEIKPKASAA